MSYSIEYDPELKKRYPLPSRKLGRLHVKLLLIMLIVFAAVYTLASGGFAQYLLPGDPQVTAAAFSGLVEQVRTGQPVKDAVFCFFRDIIVNGA